MKLQDMIKVTLDQMDEEGKRQISLRYQIEDQNNEYETLKLAVLDNPKLKELGITNSEKRKAYVIGETEEELNKIKDLKIKRDLSAHDINILTHRFNFLMAVYDTEGNIEIEPEDK